MSKIQKTTPNSKSFKYIILNMENKHTNLWFHLPKEILNFNSSIVRKKKNLGGRMTGAIQDILEDKLKLRQRIKI